MEKGAGVGFQRVKWKNPREKETWRLLVYTAEVSFSLGFFTLWFGERGGGGEGKGKGRGGGRKGGRKGLLEIVFQLYEIDCLRFVI